jgi:uncharacterized protein YndB with AHSA1/START domain
MTTFSFTTVWKIEAPLDPVWDALLRMEDWPKWWRGVDEVDVLKRGDANRIGFTSRQVWKSRLPYKLKFEGSITRIVPKSRIEITSGGELAGSGLMRFANDGKLTTFQYDWDVSTTKQWMNIVAPIAKPFFSWNHDVIMNWGAEGLAKKLGGVKVATSDKGVF